MRESEGEHPWRRNRPADGGNGNWRRFRSENRREVGKRRRLRGDNSGQAQGLGLWITVRKGLPCALFRPPVMCTENCERTMLRRSFWDGTTTFSRAPRPCARGSRCGIGSAKPTGTGSARPCTLVGRRTERCGRAVASGAGSASPAPVGERLGSGPASGLVRRIPHSGSVAGVYRSRVGGRAGRAGEGRSKCGSCYTPST